MYALVWQHTDRDGTARPQNVALYTTREAAEAAQAALAQRYARLRKRGFKAPAPTSRIEER